MKTNLKNALSIDPKLHFPWHGDALVDAFISQKNAQIGARPCRVHHVTLIAEQHLFVGHLDIVPIGIILRPRRQCLKHIFDRRCAVHLALRDVQLIQTAGGQPRECRWPHVRMKFVLDATTLHIEDQRTDLCGGGNWRGKISGRSAVWNN